MLLTSGDALKYDESMASRFTRFAFVAPRMGALWLALAVAAWFSLGSAVNVLLASLDGKRIEIVVCSGAGIKKISVPAHSTQDDTTTVKHCANAPLLAFMVRPGQPLHLNFGPPRTVASWSWMPEPLHAWAVLRDGQPPPGRAPPALAQL